MAITAQRRMATPLVILVIVSAAWAAVAGLTGPILGAAGYGVILAAVVWWMDSRAVLVGCGAGAVWHLVKLVRATGLGLPLDSVLLIVSVGLAVGALVVTVLDLRAVWSGDLHPEMRPKHNARIGIE